MSQYNVLDLNEKLKTEEKINLIDVREYVEFANGRIKESKNIPLDSVGQLHKEINASDEIFVISQKGKRSTDAADILNVIGFKNVYNVTGGINAWKEAGFSLTKDSAPPWEIERQVDFIAGFLTTASIIFAFAIYWVFVFIALFTGLLLMYSAATNTCPLCEILYRMPWNKKEAN